MKCTDRGFKALARRFRAYMNKNAGDEDRRKDWDAWANFRTTLARKFQLDNQLDERTFGELIHHVPIFRLRGRRKCPKCWEI